jgi:hypothetical protein
MWKKCIGPLFLTSVTLYFFLNVLTDENDFRILNNKKEEK